MVTSRHEKRCVCFLETRRTKECDHDTADGTRPGFVDCVEYVLGNSKVMGYILLTFYVTMAAAGYIVELLFEALGIIPQNRNVVTITEGIQWNYTTVLNILFLVLAAILVMRFVRTGGSPMLRMMDTPEQDMAS